MRGFRGAKGKVSTLIYVWRRLIFKSDVVSPCHEPRCRPANCLPRPHQRHERPDRQGNRCGDVFVGSPHESFSVRLRRRAENGGACSPAVCPATQWDKISVRLLGSVDATCVFISGCVDGHPAFPFACPTGVISPWQAIDRTATSFAERQPLEFRLLPVSCNRRLKLFRLGRLFFVCGQPS